MSQEWCTNCGEWHPGLEGSEELDSGWSMFGLPSPLPDRLLILCPNCNDKFQTSGIPLNDYILRPFKTK